MRAGSGKSSSQGTAVLLSAARVTRCGGQVYVTHVSLASSVVLVYRAGSTWPSSDDMKWSLNRISFAEPVVTTRRDKYEEAVY